MRSVLAYINEIFPREILGTMVIVFASENILEILFSAYFAHYGELLGWVCIFLMSMIVFPSWEEIDDDTS